MAEQDHTCYQEVKIALLEKGLEDLGKGLANMERRVVKKIQTNRDTVINQQKSLETSMKELCDLLKGTKDNEGLITTISLLKQSVGKAWWWLGGISLLMVSGGITGLVMLIEG